MLLVLTVYRLKMRRKYNEMKQLIRQAMVDLGSRNQPAYVSDFFDNYFKEHVLKMQSLMSDDLGQIEDDFLFDLSKLVLEHGKPERAIDQVEGVVNACSSDGFRAQNMALCRLLGDMYSKNQTFTKAYVSINGLIDTLQKMYLRGMHLEGITAAMESTMKEAYKSEYDLFVGRLCLELLIRNSQVDEAYDAVNKVLLKYRSMSDAAYGADVIKKSPLLNYCEILMEVMKAKDIASLKQLNAHYEPMLGRDPQLKEYVERIAKKHFGQTLKAPNMMQMMMNNMMKGQMPQMR